MTAVPPKWDKKRLTSDLERAIEEFRESRMTEPLEAYLELFEDYKDAFDELLEQTVDLRELSDKAMAVLRDEKLLEAVRYLSGPPISHDDLSTLVGQSINIRRLNADPQLAKRIIDTVMLGLDRRRFPWLQDGREAQEGERASAVLASAALLATTKAGTKRRNESKELQERKGVMNAEHLEECYDETMLSLGAARELARRKMADALTALDAGKEKP